MAEADRRDKHDDDGDRMTMPAPPTPTGGVTLDQGAGKAETTLLWIAMTRQVANKIAIDVAATAPAEIVLVAGEPVFDSGAIDAFDAACAMLRAQLERAVASARAAVPAGAHLIGATAVIATAGAVLNVAATAAQYFAIKHKAGNVDIAPNTMLLLTEVAALLLGAKPQPTVRLAPLDDAGARGDVIARLEQLATLAGEAVTQAVSADARATALATAASTATGADATRLQEEAAHWKHVAIVCVAAARALDEFVPRLTKDAKDGGLPLEAVIQQAALRRASDGGAATLFVTMRASGGTTLTKEGLFVGLGSAEAPIQIAAMCVGGYALFEAKTRRLMKADTVFWTSGYHDLQTVGSWFGGAPAPREWVINR